jgi:2-oxoglutarate dehydrogenase E2 component (dihydrolipoamide succinyltransferase)
MSVDVRIPTLGESVNEGVIARWIKADGAAVQIDEPLLELETDKANVEITAEHAGVLKILKPEGAKVRVGEVVARIEEGTAARPTPPSAIAQEAGAQAATPAPAKKPAEETPPTSAVLSPAVRRLVEEHKLDPRAIKASGRGGRLTKEDVLAHLEAVGATTQEEKRASEPLALGSQESAAPAPSPPRPTPAAADEEQRVPMTYLRQRIAERLVEAQRTAAILTTFNEVDMSAVMELRARYKARFSEAHGVSLGLMSFFARACIGALQDVPMVNAQIDGGDIVYHKHVHLGIAVGTERGLVVPIIHHADLMSFAEIEKEIERLADLARQHKLSIHDLSGGTFTISNGGVYGSLLSTPILNPPQSAILGMHKIEKRPVVVNDQVVVRPMMYLALSYDHRLVDGEQAVTFLVRIKERVEDPSRMMFGM